MSQRKKSNSSRTLEEGAAVLAECGRAKPKFEVTSAMLRHARLPAKFQDAAIEEEQEPKVYGFSLRLEHNIENGLGLVMMGPNGTGKTYMSCALLRMALVHTRRVMFITAPDLIQAIIHKTPFDDERTIEEVARDRDLLVLDDLGKEYRGSGSGFSEQSFDNLLRFRLTNRKSTVITTNFDMAAIEETYSAGFRSLLAESCVGITIKGDDRRRDRDRQRDMAKDSGVIS